MTRYYLKNPNSCRSDSGLSHTLNIIHLTVIALTALLYSSCKTEPTKIGNDLLPSTDFVDIRSIDTLSAFSYTAYDEATRTDNPSICYLGQINDPYFGTTYAGFVTQVRLSAKWTGEPYRIDSFKIFLNLLDVKQLNTDATHTIRVSEIADQIYTDQEYYSNTTVNLTGNYWDITLPPLKADTINELRIRLPNALAEYILRDTTQLFYSNTRADFRAYFKGLYFQMLPSSDPLFTYISPIPTPTTGYYNNSFVLYLTNMSDTTLKKQYFFIIDATNKNAAFNKFRHDYSTATLGGKMEHLNTSFRDTVSYLQYLDGVYTKIALPGLTNLKNDPSFTRYAINKAKLSIPVFFDGNLYKVKTVPPKLRLRYRTTTDGTIYEVPDYAIESTYHTFFDGSLDTVARVYNFNIPTFVDGYLKDKTNKIEPVLEVFQPDGTQNVILKTNKNTPPVKFEFIYTKF